ncbi:MAG: tetratricopeptide repeat protein [Bacteroidota bacterium]|nr:tetratricopeptide repeat protein [Ferruginibacter sp.]
MKALISAFAGIIFLFSTLSGYSQTAKELQETARSFMQQGDFSNAGLVLSRATALDPQNVEIIKDLAINYQLQKDNKKALEAIKPIIEREDADDQSFQIAGDIYYKLGEPKEAEKVYRRGLKKYPASGIINNELGELLWKQRDYEAIKYWEKGIEMEPNYSKNYYNACKFYYFTTDKVWSIVYGETFINMEPLNARTPEIKSILLESYKKLFIDTDYSKDNKEKNRFTDAFLQVIKKQNNVATSGLNPESLTMIRTRFILDWYNNYATLFPNKLFDLQRQLLQEGIFEAYNQWIFGITQNLATYQTWTATHSEQNNEFSRFQKGRIYKVPTGQYYRIEKVTKK